MLRSKSLLQNTISVTAARGELGKLVSGVKDEQTILLTKRGKPKAVLVDIQYWEEVLNRLKEAYQKTFIDPKLMKYTRKFSEKETKEWLKEDQL